MHVIIVIYCYGGYVYLKICVSARFESLDFGFTLPIIKNVCVFCSTYIN
jgi:hypothetical protein